MKVAINVDIGGFALRREILLKMYEVGSPLIHAFDGDEDRKWYEMQLEEINKYTGEQAEQQMEWLKNQYVFAPDGKVLYWGGNDIDRADPLLIQLIEEYDGNAHQDWQSHRKIKIVEVPNDVKWYIHEDDCGYEVVHEEHRMWY